MEFTLLHHVTRKLGPQRIISRNDSLLLEILRNHLSLEEKMDNNEGFLEC